MPKRTSEEAETIGQKIRRLRQSKGLSLTDLHKLSDVHWNTIARIERGVFQKSHYDTIKSLLRALGERHRT